MRPQIIHSSQELNLLLMVSLHLIVDRDPDRLSLQEIRRITTESDR